MPEHSFSWPDNAEECAALARSVFISECASHACYWFAWGSHFLTHLEPDTPYVRSWSAVAKEDRAFRDVFAMLSESQRTKILELIQRCVRGAVFSTLCTLDQFPHGEAEVFVREGERSFRLAPASTTLHDDFMVAYTAQSSTADTRTG